MITEQEIDFFPERTSRISVSKLADTHTYTHTYKHKQQEKLPAAVAAKKRVCHINIFKHIREDLLCVE